MYEALTGKAYYKIETEEDVLYLLYSCFCVSNPDIKITFKIFKNMLKDKRVMKWIRSQYELVSQFQVQFRQEQEAENEEKGEEGEETEPPTACELASSLIVRYGLDIRYVMEEMEMWEMVPLFKEIERKRKNDLKEKRLWTYLQVAPNIDTKKVKSPEKFLPFAWEQKENSENARKNLEKNAASVKNILGRKLF